MNNFFLEVNTVCILRYVICVVSCYLKNTQVHVLENSACQESELYNHLLFIDHILAASLDRKWDPYTPIYKKHDQTDHK